MKALSIRTRLTFWYTGLLGLTLLLLGGAAYALLSYNVSHDVDIALSGVARALAEQTRRSGPGFPPHEVDEAFRRFFGFSPWNRYFGMVEPPGFSGPSKGRLPVNPKARERAFKGLSTFETLEGLSPYPVRVLTFPVVEGGEVVRVMQIGMSLEVASKTRRSFLITLAAVFPVGLLLAGAGGWLLARRALRPVDRMAETARRISAEHLAARLDVTDARDELSRLAHTLNEMLERLDTSFRQIRQFSADASHELQTPLTILKGEIEVALRQPRSAEEYQGVLKSALEEIDRVARLVESLLLLARADAGVLRMDFRPVDLARLAEDVCALARGLADRRGISLFLEDPEPLSVQGDPERLRQVLLNLVDNGIKYTPSGGRVTVSLRREGDRASLRVTDTGIGLSVEDRKKIFERFYRSSPARSLDEGGAGLGLCIARSIVDAHQGEIRVESSPGSGSSFTVLLPLQG